MMIDQHIEELRAELKNASTRKERHQIKAKLAAAIAACDALIARIEGSEPLHQGRPAASDAPGRVSC